MSGRVVADVALGSVAEPARAEPPRLAPQPFNGTLDPWAEAALERETAELAAMPAGSGRHRKLFASAAALYEIEAGGCLPAALIDDGLRRACESNGMLPGREAEFERTLADARDVGRANPRTAPQRSPVRPAAAEAATTEAREPAPEPVADADLPALPEVCWRVPFADFRDAYAETTEAPDAYHFAACLVTASALIGRSAWKGPAGGSKRQHVNVYAGLVGASGKSRKTTAFGEAEDEIRELDADVVLNHGVGSGAALVEMLAAQEPIHGPDGNFVGLRERARTRAVLFAGELGSLLYKARQDGSKELIPRLLQAYDCPRVLENRTRQKPVRAEDPYLCVFAATTPSGLKQDFTLSDIAGGFVGRIVFFTGERKRAMPEQGPEDLDALKRARTVLLAARDRNPSGKAYELSPEARRLWERWYRNDYDREDSDPVLATIATRLQTNAMKLAVIYAVCEGTDQITADQIGAAIAFADYQRAVQAALFGDFGETDRGRLERRVLETLKRRGPLPTYGLRQQIRTVSAEDLKRAIDALVKVGEIQQQRTKTGRGVVWTLRGASNA